MTKNCRYRDGSGEKTAEADLRSGRHKEFCILGALDIKNAFSTAPWYYEHVGIHVKNYG